VNNIFGYNFSTLTFNDTIDKIVDFGLKKKSSYVCVSNVHMLVTATKSNKFSRILENADLSILDGMPLCWTYKFKYGYQPERIAGRHLMHSLINASIDKKMSIYIYGSEQHKLDKAKEYILINYPGVQIAGMYSPPFRMLTTEEENEVVQNINNSGANIVFVALGCPKQEVWMHKMKGKINATMLGIGIAIETLTKQQMPTPKCIENIGFEWLFRLVKEPKKLFKRYLITNSIFFKLLFLELLFNKNNKVLEGH
jgi:N-acetylglucosaminyldiphosphoundecaprenol N-acetyl-beta-D-mannosaminyltransferase